MAANGQTVPIGATATLIFSLVDGVTYSQNGYTPGGNPTIFKTGTTNDPIPILVIFALSNTIYLGGSGVTTSAGALATNLGVMSYNAVGGDSLYGIVATGTQTVQLLVLRQ